METENSKYTEVNWAKGIISSDRFSNRGKQKRRPVSSHIAISSEKPGSLEEAFWKPSLREASRFVPFPLWLFFWAHPPMGRKLVPGFTIPPSELQIKQA